MHINKIISIDKIVKKGICNGCGTCYSICPQEAIAIIPNFQKGIFSAVIDPYKCIKCRQCIEVCHSHDTIFKGNFLNTNLIGQYKHIYSGYSTDEILRFNASSGGIISAILKYLTEKNHISGVILVRPDTNSPFIHEAFISDNVLDIKKYCGTRYFPIPINKILRELIEKDGQYVLIGTPCQIHSINLFERREPQIREKILLKIAFFCGGTPNLNAYRYYIQQHKIKESSISSIYRGQGWPGHNVLQTLTGERICIPRRPQKYLHKIYHTLAFFPIFTMKRCLLCNDRFGVYSDISLGDAWLNRFKNDTKGTSLIIIRTETGDKLINAMMKDDVINISPISKNELIESQKIFFEYYKNYLKTMSMLMGNEHIRNFKFDKNYKPDFFWPVKLFIILLGWRLSEKKYLWRFLFIYGFFFQIMWNTISLISQKIESQSEMDD